MRPANVMIPRVIAVHPEATVMDAARLMLRTGVSGVPVLAGAGTLVGILTEQDLMRRAELGTQRKRSPWLTFLTSPGKLAEEFAQSHGRKVAEVMTHEVITVSRHPCSTQ